MERVGAGAAGRRRRSRGASRRSTAWRPSLAAGRRARMPSRSHVRRIRGGDLAAVGDEQRPDRRAAGALDSRGLPPANASNASNATRQRPPTRRAGSRPVAIQRWTERVEVPSALAAWLGLSSSGAVMARLSRSPRREARRDASRTSGCPATAASGSRGSGWASRGSGSGVARRASVGVGLGRSSGPRPDGASRERPEALLRLGSPALPGDDPGGVPLRGPVGQAADLADDRLGGPGGASGPAASRSRDRRRPPPRRARPRPRRPRGPARSAGRAPRRTAGRRGRAPGRGSRRSWR